MHLLLHLLLIAMRTRVTRSGSAWKDVTCERCRAEYEYELSRSVTEEGLASERTLARRADARLARALANGCDPFPCPGCGWLQSGMVRVIRRRASDLPGWVVVLVFAAIAAFIATGVAANRPDPQPDSVAVFATAGALCAAPLAVFGTRRARQRFADPNAKPGGSDSADLGRDFE